MGGLGGLGRLGGCREVWRGCSPPEKISKSFLAIRALAGLLLTNGCPHLILNNISVCWHLDRQEYGWRAEQIYGAYVIYTIFWRPHINYNIYIYIYTIIYIYIYMPTYIYTHICRYVCIYIYIYICVCACIYIHKT